MNFLMGANWSLMPGPCGSCVLVLGNERKYYLFMFGQYLYHSGRAHTSGAEFLRSLVWILPGAVLFSTLILSNVSLNKSLEEIHHFWFSNSEAKLCSSGQTKLGLSHFLTISVASIIKFTTSYRSKEVSVEGIHRNLLSSVGWRK